MYLTAFVNKLFTKFNRLDEDLNTTVEGTGLGLAITKSLVELMNGKINVQSQFGEGSIFMVTIPQKIGNENYTDILGQNIFSNNENNNNNNNLEKTENNMTNLKIKKILIVDDSKLNVKVAHNFLKTFEVVECYSGKECINLINKSSNFDLILMDIMMPEMDGVETLKILKKIPNFNVPVVALTADAIVGAREKYLAEGFSEYLVKPFLKEQLIKIVDKLI